jgi:hypothetical protein
MKLLRPLSALTVFIILFASCEKDPGIEQIHSDLEMMNDWQEFEIGENEELIFKITITSEDKLDISWKEEPFMKDTDAYTADIIVSAYRPDGVTPYFEDEDNGYQDDSELIDIIEGDMQVILIITAREGLSGSFAIRVRGITETLVTDPKEIDFGLTWVGKNCYAGDVKWLKVDCGSETDVSVEWMEFDRPETGSIYTADIKVSVYSELLDVNYLLDQNHGYGDNARAISLTHSSSIIYIRVMLNDDELDGSYAIRVFPTPVN